MIDGAKIDAAYFTLSGEGELDQIAHIYIYVHMCRCDVFRDGRVIPGDVPEIRLPIPADEESKSIVNDWLASLKRSWLLKNCSKIYFNSDSTYLAEVIRHGF